MLNFPGAPKSEAKAAIRRMSRVRSQAKEPPKPAAPATEPPKPDGVVVYPEQTPQISASERAILERLQARRQELETRAREIEIRESLLKSAEKRIEGKVEELKAVEARISTASGVKSEADAARFKGIITMYEGMKPKDAAKVFDRLEMAVLYEIASQIAPRKMSIRHPRPDAAGSGRTADGRTGAPGRQRQGRTDGGTAQDRGQDAGAEDELG